MGEKWAVSTHLRGNLQPVNLERRVMPNRYEPVLPNISIAQKEGIWMEDVVHVWVVHIHRRGLRGNLQPVILERRVMPD